MAIITISGGERSTALITVAEADALLTDTDRFTGWDALTDDEKAAAIRDVTADFNRQSWIGTQIFGKQALALPTDKICDTRTITAGAGSDINTIVSTELNINNTSGLSRDEYLYGSVMIHDTDDADYNCGAHISAYARTTGTLTLLQTELTESPEDKSVTLVYPLPREIREAVAIQAYERKTAEVYAKAINQAHAGFRTLGKDGAVVVRRGPQAILHVDAGDLVSLYISKSLTVGRC